MRATSLSHSHRIRAAKVIAIALIGLTTAATAQEDTSGVLDLPVVIQTPAGMADAAPAGLTVDEPALLIAPDELEQRVQEDFEELEQLPMTAVEDRAESGERAAQVVLGNGFAEEAAMLGFAPAAANEALADAARWYSRAAARGFPGAPSLDQAGVRFYPIRVQREF